MTGPALQRFLRSPLSQQLAALEALSTLIGFVLLLNVLPYRLWRGLLVKSILGAAVAATGTSTGTPANTDLTTARQIGKLVASVARNLPGRPQCLTQALAARAMLRRRGITSELNLGVNKDRGAVSAHAWLSVGKLVVTGGPDVSGFAVFGKQA